MELLPLPEHNCYEREVFIHCGTLMCKDCYSRHQYTEHKVIADYELWEGTLVPISEWLNNFEAERKPIVRTSSAQRTVNSMSDEQLLQLEAALKLKMNKSFDNDANV